MTSLMEFKYYLYWTKFISLHKILKVCSPLSVCIIVTRRCNLDCKICGSSILDRKKGEAEISLNLFSKLIRDLIKIGTRSIWISGGEPFIRKDILKLMKKIKKNGLEGVVYTNGTLINEEIIQKLIRMRWDTIIFSLDGPTNKQHDLIRGKSVYDTVIRNIEKLNEIKKEKGALFPQIKTNTVILNTNYNVLHEMVLLARKYNITAANFNLYTPVKKSFVLKKWQIKVASRELEKAHILARKLRIRTNALAIRRLLVNPCLAEKCFMPIIHSTIDSNGDVYPCTALLPLSKEDRNFYKNAVIGNIKEESIVEIWQGEKYQKLRKMLKKGKFLELCKVRCKYHRCSIINDFLSSLSDFKLIDSFEKVKGMLS